MSGQNESRPDRVAGIPAGPDYMAQSIARKKSDGTCSMCNGRGTIYDNADTPFFKSHACPQCTTTPQPSDSTEMPEAHRLNIDALRNGFARSSIADTALWLATDRERVIRERDNQYDENVNQIYQRGKLEKENSDLWASIRQNERDGYMQRNSMSIAEIDAINEDLSREAIEHRSELTDMTSRYEAMRLERDEAVKAEREACADLVEDVMYLKELQYEYCINAGDKVAAAIRSRAAKDGE